MSGERIDPCDPLIDSWSTSGYPSRAAPGRRHETPILKHASRCDPSRTSSRPRAWLFGGTVLGTETSHTRSARASLWAANEKGDFDTATIRSTASTGSSVRRPETWRLRSRARPPCSRTAPRACRMLEHSHLSRVTKLAASDRVRGQARVRRRRRSNWGCTIGRPGHCAARALVAGSGSRLGERPGGMLSERRRREAAGSSGLPHRPAVARSVHDVRTAGRPSGATQFFGPARSPPPGVGGSPRPIITIRAAWSGPRRTEARHLSA